jgi:ABC-type spermidine/putrescine transport system permease subunit I
VKAPWFRVMAGPLLVTLVLLAGSQAVFLRASLYRDLGYGLHADTPSLDNYVRILTDPFTYDVLWTTASLSAIAAAWTVGLGFPTAYVLARSRSRWALAMLALILLSAFVTIAIKIYGLMILFAANGVLNQALLAAHLVAAPVTLIGTRFGVVVGFSYFSFGFAVLLLYGVVRTIPRSLEDAAAAHGAGRLRTMLRVVLPLSLPGLGAAYLTVFNLCMGAFTSAALLGAGRVLTLPVLIERTILAEARYGRGGALAALLMAVVLAANLVAARALRRPA